MEITIILSVSYLPIILVLKRIFKRFCEKNFLLIIEIITNQIIYMVMYIILMISIIKNNVLNLRMANIYILLFMNIIPIISILTENIIFFIKYINDIKNGETDKRNRYLDLAKVIPINYSLILETTLLSFLFIYIYSMESLFLLLLLGITNILILLTSLFLTIKRRSTLIEIRIINSLIVFVCAFFNIIFVLREVNLINQFYNLIINIFSSFIGIPTTIISVVLTVKYENDKNIPFIEFVSNNSFVINHQVDVESDSTISIIQVGKLMNTGKTSIEIESVYINNKKYKCYNNVIKSGESFGINFSKDIINYEETIKLIIKNNDNYYLDYLIKYSNENNWYIDSKRSSNGIL